MRLQHDFDGLVAREPAPARPRLTPSGRARLAAFLAAVIALAGVARGGFVNAGFEANNFSGWTLEWANYNGGAISFSPTAFPAGHPAPTIVTSASFGTVSIPSALCGNYMARINDLIGCNHATRISQSAALMPADLDDCGVATVTVCWIGVVCDPTNTTHADAQQPAFSFELVHTSGGVSTIVDSSFIESKNAGKPGSGWTSAGPCATPDPFCTNSGVLYYRQYCTPLIVLDASPGDLLTVRAYARDCSLGAHGAMAFVDCVTLQPGLPTSGASNLDPSCFDDLDFPPQASALLTPNAWGTTPAPAGCPTLRAAGDFNGDGKSDVAEYRKTALFGGCATSGGVWTMVSNGSAFASLAPNAATGAPLGALGWQRLRTGDFDGDGFQDVIGFRSNGANPALAWGSASGLATTTTPFGSSVSTGIRSDLWVGDFNGDGRDDLARIDNNAIRVAPAQPPTVCTVVRASPFLPFAIWRPGTSPIQINGTFYSGDFNGDGLCDLAASMPNGIFLFRSTGSSFAAPVLWFAGVAPPSGGFVAGDFDCDGTCDFARRNPGTGRVEMLIGVSLAAGFGAPVAPPFNAGWSRLSFVAVNTTQLLVGDFDGNGRDDFFQNPVSNQVTVHRSCDPCPCLEIKAGTPLCDPNDATKYTLPLRIRNLTPFALSSVGLQALTGFSVTPSPVSVLSPSPCFAQLLPRKSRAVSVMVTGVTPNVPQQIRGSVLVIPPGGDIYLCSDRTCFTPPPCSCMQAFPSGDGAWFECEPTASGAACLNLSVKNTSGITVCAARITSLTPGISVSPSVVCIPPLTTGSVHTFNPCQIQFTGSSSSGAVTLLVELFDCNATGCDDCACHPVCDEEISFDYTPCPREIGECCITPGGIQFLTLRDCQAAGGIWAPPGTSLHCPQNWGRTAASLMRLDPVGADTFVTFAADRRMFVSQIPADGSGGADLSVNAARRILVPLEEITAEDDEAQPSVTLRVDGIFAGAPDVRFGELVLTRLTDGTFTASANFGPVGATGVELTRVVDGAPASTVIAGPSAVVTMPAWPASIETFVASGRPGFRFVFASLTQIQVSGVGTVPANAFSLTAVTSSAQANHLTRVELRGAGLARIASATAEHESSPCLGDLNGDCVVNQTDMNIVQAGFGGAAESDANGDGVVNILDLQIVLAALNTTCACAGEPSPIIPGDTNCDDFVTVGDISAFVLALTDPAGYASQYPGCDISSADVNADGFVTVGDIGPFVALLTGG